ncbi:MAG TPA: metalloregulator ArsR/SmtB family transcription factor [Acidimicrobiales bacterium]|nr:metalloregulator ArsR/SmtB family transcription factor [Acidimicrobiales bacterium]
MISRPRGLAELEDYDAVFGALGHATRRMILTVLKARGGEMTSGAIAARFDCAWPTTTQHLKVLEEAGLVTVRAQGRERLYRLESARMHSVVRSWIDRFTSAPHAGTARGSAPDRSGHESRRR